MLKEEMWFFENVGDGENAGRVKEFLDKKMVEAAELMKKVAQNETL